MTAIEDRLRDLGRSVSPPDLPTTEQVARRGQQRRRRRRTVRTLAALTAVLLVPLVSVQLAGDGDRAQVVSGGPPDPTRLPGVTQLDESGIPAVIFATNVWDGSLLVSDLDGGFHATYPDGQHALGFKDPEDIQDVPDGTGPGSTTFRLVAAALTDGELVAGVQDAPIAAFSAARNPDGCLDLMTGALQEPGREIYGSDDWRGLVATSSGDALWVQTGAGDLELVDIETGEVRRSVPRPAGTNGSRLIGVAGDSAVLQNGDNNHASVIIVTPAGETSVVERPGPASFVAASPTRSVWLTGVTTAGIGQSVLVVGDDGETTSIPVPDGAGGRWAWIGSQVGMGNMRTLTADGTRLLLTLTDANEPSSTIPTRLVVVDIEQGTADVVFEGPGGVEGFWAGDDRTAIAVAPEGRFGTSLTAIDTVTGATSTIDNAVPPGFKVIAAR